MTESLTLGDSLPSEPGALYGPLRLALGSDRRLFVVDDGDLTVKRFSPVGRIEQVYGKGRGQGPGELLALSDVAVAEDGALWIADAVNGRISIFDEGGTLAATIKPELPPYCLAALTEQGAVLMLNIDQKTLFGHFDRSGRALATFGEFALSPMERIALDGYVVQAGPRRFVYAPRYLGWLAGFSADGRTEFVVETIDPAPPPRLRQEGGRVWIDPETRLSTYSATVLGDRLYLLSGEGNRLHYSDTLDVYDLGDGAYLHSILLPVKALQAVAAEDALYLVRETTITAWSLRPGALSG